MPGSRLQRHREGRLPVVKRSPAARGDRAPALRPRRPGRIGAGVITSYSIHYTKLYESPGFAARFGNGLGRLLWKMLRKRRKLARRAIAEHLGVPKDEAKRIAKASFKQNVV